MANLHRGEINAVINGKTETLCLTLGALAELEASFGVDDLTALASRFEQGRLSARDCIRIMTAGLRGGGARVSEDEVATMVIEGGVTGTARIISELLIVTFGQGQTPENPTQP